MNHVMNAATLSLALASTALVSGAIAQTTPPDEDPKIGTRVTVTGCLHEGTSRGSFVLLGVTERPADASAPIRPVPLAIYWLDSTKGLKDLVGEMVDITGTITGRRGKPGTITVDIDVSESRSTDVQVASGNKDLDVTSKKFDDRPRPAETSTSDSTLTVSRPVYKLDVEKVGHAANFPVTGQVCR